MTDQSVTNEMDWEHGTPMMVGPWMVGWADPSPETIEYWHGVDEGRLLLKQCGGCARFHHPRRLFCFDCGSDEMSWVEAKGSGTIYTFSTVSRAPTEALQEETPYTIALVELEEGVFFCTRIIDDGKAIAIGSQVDVAFEPVAAYESLPVFHVR